MTLCQNEVTIVRNEAVVRSNSYALVQKRNLSKLREVVESCIFDDLKPLFGINSTGRDYYIKKSKVIYFQHVSYNCKKKEWYQDLKLEKEQKYSQEVLKILLFRRFFGLPGGVACLRTRLDPCSEQEKIITWSDDFYPRKIPENNDIPFRFIKKTIKKYNSLNDLLREMTGIETRQDVELLLKKIKKIIKKYDSEYLFLVSYSKRKLLELLS